VLQGIEKLGTGEGAVTRVRAWITSQRDHIAGGELLEDHAGQGTDLAGLENRVLLGFADSIGTGAQGAATAADSAARRLDQSCLPFQLGEDAIHHGGENLEELLAHEG
jgi:hypothetical protein